MPDEARLIAAFVLALGAGVALTPVAILVANRAGFVDRPVGWKTHAAPTPYLGGAAVIAAFALATLLTGADGSGLAPLVAGAGAMWLIGTIDDRRPLPASLRLALEAAIATLLWAFDLGWNVFDAPALDLTLTIVWVVAVVNAFNVFDIMDGAAAIVAAVSALSLAAIASIEGNIALAVVVLGLAGACLGFLPYNMAGPARIFLGDGGSMPIGFVLAAAAAALSHTDARGIELLLVATLVVGIPTVDIVLRIVSRRRARITLLTAGNDGIAHRLLPRLGSTREVAIALGLGQAALGAIAVGASELGEGSIIAAWTTWFIGAAGAIALLETSSWAPERSAAQASLPGRRVARGPVDPGTGLPSPAEVLVIAFIAIACGLSPFLYGFYEVGVWGPIALGMLAAFLGLLIARPAAPRATALVAGGALALFWLWALLSTSWAESADQAMTEANRWLLYAALFGVLVLLIRDDRLGVIVLGAAAATIVAFGGYLLVRMLAGSAADLFLGGRLNEPLGYVNGQAGFLLVGVWPLVALAERARQPWLAGVGAAGVSALLGLVLLGQTRSVLPAVALSVVAMLVLVPGRTRRAWIVVAVACGLAVALGPVLEVYDSARAAEPDDSVIRDAAIAILLGSALAGVLWGALAAAAPVAARRFGSQTRTRVAAWAPLAVLALVGGFALLAAVDDPVGSVREEYRSFTELMVDTGDSTRFTSGGGNRYDYWRVAWHQFEDEPLRGVGAGNYDRTYFLERRSTEDIRQAHSIELQALGELGLIGAALLLTFLVAVGIGFARRARAAREDLRARGLAVAAGGAFAVWLVQTSVDWMHLIPGATGIVLCSAAVLVGPWRSDRGSKAGRTRIVVVAVGAVVVVFAAVLVGRAALAHRYVEDGRERLPSDPAGAIEKANDALRLNDEALPAYYVEAAAWARLNDYPRARAALIAAAAREPHDFVTYALLGDLATRRGDDRRALRAYRRALALNPRNDALGAAVEQARRRAARG